MSAATGGSGGRPPSATKNIKSVIATIPPLSVVPVLAHRLSPRRLAGRLLQSQRASSLALFLLLTRLILSLSCDSCHKAKRRCGSVPGGTCERCNHLRKDCMWKGYDEYWGCVLFSFFLLFFRFSCRSVVRQFICVPEGATWPAPNRPSRDAGHV